MKNLRRKLEQRLMNYMPLWEYELYMNEIYYTIYLDYPTTKEEIPHEH